MIMVRSPMRITLGGGGTDLPSYYSDHNGLTVSAAIDKFIYISLVKPFDNKIRLKYSEQEICNSVDEITHPLLRATLETYGGEFSEGIEICSQADVPAGTGLGSSGAFTVGLCQALNNYRNIFGSSLDVAQLACEIEIEKLGRPVGKQDQYISAIGGLQKLRFNKNGSVSSNQLQIPEVDLGHLEDNLLMFFTGYSRAASNVLNDQDKRTRSSDKKMLVQMHEVKASGERVIEILEAGDVDGFAAETNEHWHKKRERSPGMSNSKIDQMYEFGMKNGALGGKLVGAGSGGFFLFVAKDKRRLRNAFASQNVKEMPFRFCPSGVETIAR